MSEAKSIFIYFYASSPDAAALMFKFVFVYLTNMAVLCYSLTIICCCQVQDYIYWIISTENDHRHHQTCSAYLVNKIFANSARLWTRSASLISFQRSNCELIPYIYPAFVPFGRYFTYIHLSLWIGQSLLYSTRWHFLFYPRNTCCVLFLSSAHAQDVLT